MFYILARLSERFGSVIKMRPRYRYYYTALIFLSIGWLANLIVILANLMPAALQEWFYSPWFLLLAYYLPLGIGLTIGLVITWSYWSWLVADRG
jgi:hypothetical protein